MKQSSPIDRLLTWAYCDELPKRLTSSADGIWDRIGGLGAGSDQWRRAATAAQRYAHAGLPHPDAEAIEAAVDALRDEPIDWATREICGDLWPLVAAHLEGRDVVRVETVPGGVSSDTGRRWAVDVGADVIRHDRRGNPRRAAPGVPYEPRERSTSLIAVMVRHHAMMGTVPDWGASVVPQPHRVPAERSPAGTAHVLGRKLRQGWYAAGSTCPLRWSPNPIDLARRRGAYVAWHRALLRLVEVLRALSDHAAVAPDAPAMPWAGSEARRAVLAVRKPMLGAAPVAEPRPRALGRQGMRVGQGGPVRRVSVGEAG